MEAVQILAVIFGLGVVAPIWIVFHYIYGGKRKVQAASGSQDKAKIEELLAIAHKMEDRIDTLEAILDKKDDRWRYES